MTVTMKFTKGHNFVQKNVDEILVLISCTLSDHALYLYQSSLKYLKLFQGYWADMNFNCNYKGA